MDCLFPTGTPRSSSSASPPDCPDEFEFVIQGAIGMHDPRRDRPTCNTEVSVIAFYYPGCMADCDTLCGCPYLGNFFGAPVNLGDFTFANAEGAFQALQFWSHAHKFQDKMGEDVLQLVLQLAEVPDGEFAGYGSNWAAMMEVLRAKFRHDEMYRLLIATGDSMLLEHNSEWGIDCLWSNNQNGSGRNWLGMQLMLLRDELRGDRNGRGNWTDFIRSECQIDLSTGEPADKAGAEAWQKVVEEATRKVHDKLGTRVQIPPENAQQCQKPGQLTCEPGRGSGSSAALAQKARSACTADNPQDDACMPLCIRAGCNRPAFNGCAGKYCSRTCRDIKGPHSQSYLAAACKLVSFGYASTPLPAEEEQPLAPAICKRPGCQYPPYNGQLGFYCSRKCEREHGRLK